MSNKLYSVYKLILTGASQADLTHRDIGAVTRISLQEEDRVRRLDSRRHG